MRLRTTLFSGLLALTVLGLASCGEGNHYGDPSVELGNVQVGFQFNYSAELVADGLMNPTSLDWRGDMLTVTDSGHGKVIGLKKDGENWVSSDLVTGFETEYWKPATEADTTARFKLGPLSHLWLEGGALVVSNGGLKDGEDCVTWFGSVDGTVKASAGQNSNGIPKTSTDAIDNGEGNFVGFASSNDGKTIWIAGQGADAKSWVLSYDVATKKLSTRFSADDNGIATNSPMDIIVRPDDTLLVLYSGVGGAEDGLVVHWDPKSGKPAAQWTLPGIKDPMGFDKIPGTHQYVVVDNNWDLKKVNHGSLSRVTLPDGGGAAKVEMLADEFDGPVSCRFGPDGRLYVVTLGEAFDSEKGQVLVINGF